jgi:hypothetical protein
LSVERSRTHLERRYTRPSFLVAALVIAPIAVRAHLAVRGFKEATPLVQAAPSWQTTLCVFVQAFRSMLAAAFSCPLSATLGSVNTTDG